MKRPAFLKRFLPRLRGFARDEHGIASMEMMLMLPLYLFCIFGTFTYWDAFDVSNRSQKAAYSVSDLLTRNQDMQGVSETYVNGMFTTMQYMMGDTLPTRTRVTSIFFSDTDGYRVLWSRSSATTLPRLTTSSLDIIQDHLPVMFDGDALIVVEAMVDFEPMFSLTNWAMQALDMDSVYQVVVTRPRFMSRICLRGVACS
ncbi:TadE/TadG family type IV pilus assembly protein [Pseudotabrizicola formosa]|uniref:TadE/TadG family type IV pilus assembly protein n=1 Tax=Pseudotabrizicola formosa TaxID=2030009 RepID=UPI000CD08534|nr:pilus assembly protein [Pseudotabrizicola formosa]